ncbi:hypothetical protein D3C80_1357240 [compost metagenome]
MTREEQVKHLDGSQYRQQIGGITQAETEKTGYPGAHPAGRILHLHRAGRNIDSRIQGGIGQQGHEEEDTQHNQPNHCRLFQAIVQLLAPRSRRGVAPCIAGASGPDFGGICGTLQNVFLPAHSQRSKSVDSQNTAYCKTLPGGCHSGRPTARAKTPPCRHTAETPGFCRPHLPGVACLASVSRRLNWSTHYLL